MLQINRLFNCQSCKLWLYKQACRVSSNVVKTGVESDSPNQNNEKVTEKCDKKKTSLCREEFRDPLSLCTGHVTVCIIGGGLKSVYASVLLKQCHIIKSIHLLDTTESLRGNIMDANHIDTTAKIKYFKKKHIKEAVSNVDIVALMDEINCNICHMNPRTVFYLTAHYVREMTDQLIQFCPKAVITIFARPVTATLAMVSEMFKCSGCWDPNRIIGSTSMECMRIEALTAQFLDLNPAFLSIPMVGGADATTVVPLFSCAKPINQFTHDQEHLLLRSMRDADKKLSGTDMKESTLSWGAAVAKLILAIAGGFNDLGNIVFCAYVRSNALPMCRFFTCELEFGPGGIKKNFGVPKLSQNEISLVEQSIPFINEYVQMAIETVHNTTAVKTKF